MARAVPRRDRDLVLSGPGRWHAGRVTRGRGPCHSRTKSETPMTATSAAGNAHHARRARTGGPEDGSKLMEYIAGWAFVVVFAMLVTQIGLL
ncbi:hypothetical protein SSIG_00721 [Streptomyces filamentosus NRRL 11379]|nr:hypothetical protein SSIG_00721 [Streptomyces filamentosus NRRL 11379]